MSYQYKDINKYGVVQIPKHWDLTILSRVADVIDPEPSHRAPAFAKGEGFPYVGIRDINFDGTVNIETARPIEEESLIEQEKRFIIEPSDIVFCRVATLGLPKILKTDKRIALSATLALIKSKKGIDYRYLLYYLESDVIKVQTALYATGSTRKSLGMETIRKFSVFVPSYEEQVEIAKYLKSKLDVIDNLISDKSNIINLLEEKRKSMITEAVTKGLNPNVEMKDSGVEWIGKMPEHWELNKIGYLGRLQNGISKSADEFGFGYPFVSYGDVYKNTNLPRVVGGLVNSSEEEQDFYSVRKGDVFFTRTSETVEEIGIASTCLKTIDKATFAGFLIRFRPTTQKLLASYSKYYFRSDLGRRYFVKEVNLVTRASLGQGLLRNFPVMLPSLDEQNEIAEYLDAKTRVMSESINLIKNQIQKLKEYRQSLIYEAVTGKIDVSDFEIKA